MFVPCRVFAVYPLAPRLLRRQRGAKDPAHTEYRWPENKDSTLKTTVAAAAEYCMLGPGHHPFLSQFASATETLLVA